MVRYKTINRFCEESGYTAHAVRTKIQRGVWIEGRVWRRAPDGHILIDVEGFHQWVENGNGLACRGPDHAKKMASSPASRPATKGGSPPPLVTQQAGSKH